MKQTQSYIAPDVEIDGDIFSEGPVRFDGRCEGAIEVRENLTIGHPSVIRGKVMGSSIVVNGTIVGEVVSTRKLAILAQGNVTGDISTPSGGVSISKGGNLEGGFYVGEIPQRSWRDHQPEASASSDFAAGSASIEHKPQVAAKSPRRPKKDANHGKDASEDEIIMPKLDLI